MKNYDQTNYFEDSYGTFKECAKPTRTPDYVSVNYRYNSKSEYWYEGEFLYRNSDHWSGYYIAHGNENKISETIRIASCKWFLRIKKRTNKRELCGRIKFSDLKRATVKR